MAKLGDCISQAQVERCGNNQYPVLSITMQDGLVLQSEKFKKRIASVDTSDYLVIPRGKLVQGIHIDEGNFDVQNLVEAGIVSPAYKVWDINTNRVWPEYLVMYLRSPKAIAYFKTKLIGTVSRRGRMTQSDFMGMQIPLPTIDEQKAIVDKLNKLATLISLRKQQIAKLDELVKARFVEMFGDPVENAKNYLVKSLQELIDMGYIIYHLDGNHGGDYPRSEEFVDCGVPYIGANSIANGEIDFSMAKFVTAERAGKLRKGIAQNEDVLFAHNATVGPVVVLHTDEPKVILSTSLTAYRCNKEKLLPNYLKAFMQSEGFVRQYSGEMKQTTRNQVPITAQKKYLFLVPPIAEQEQFAAFVAQTDQQKSTIQHSLAQLELLKKALMQKYFG